MPKNEYMCDCNVINQEIVTAAKKDMPDEIIFDKLTQFYKIIGDKTRCKILFALVNREMCVCDLANVLSMTKSSVSHQLRKMKNNGIVKFRKDGKSVYYSLDDEHVKILFEISMTHIKHKI